MRNLLYAGCLIPGLLFPFKLEPTPADQIPPGYHEVGRFQEGQRHHVIFSNGHHWRWYINGRLDCKSDEDGGGTGVLK
jgi:hypothetical protein